MQVHTDSDKAWVFSTQDYADQEGSFETFCIRFGSPERKPRIPIGSKTKSSGLMRVTDGQQPSTQVRTNSKKSMKKQVI